MSRKEDIIYATLELAAENGLKAVTLSQIADRVGIRKPSLYNHFKSKEEIVNEMYVFLREQARSSREAPAADPAAMFAGKTLSEILLMAYRQYAGFIANADMLRFLKVIYSERSTSPTAAQIVLEETERMTSATKGLFYALVVHGKMRNNSVDTAAVSFTMTIHSLVDKYMDMVTAGRIDFSELSEVPQEVREYIIWFSEIMEADNNG